MTGSRRAFLAGAGGVAIGAAVATTAAGPAAAAGAGSAAAPGTAVPLMTTRVADSGRGVDRKALARLAPGEKVELRREPGNDYDARAVAVHTLGGVKVGYIPRARAEALGNLIDAGFATSAVVREVRTGGVRPEPIIGVGLLTG